MGNGNEGGSGWRAGWIIYSGRRDLDTKRASHIARVFSLLQLPPKVPEITNCSAGLLRPKTQPRLSSWLRMSRPPEPPAAQYKPIEVVAEESSSE